MNNIYLTGFMATGKTTVSRILSELSSKALYDTDYEIEKKLNLKINDIFGKFGEEYFREQEYKMLLELSSKENCIISTGGGIVLRDLNRELMKKTGIIVALIPEFNVIKSRISRASSTRPLLSDDLESIYKRYCDRLPLYKDCTYEINPKADTTPAEIADKILKFINLR